MCKMMCHEPYWFMSVCRFRTANLELMNNVDKAFIGTDEATLFPVDNVYVHIQSIGLSCFVFI